MRLIIIRHAEPDYENNTITANGFIEASALSDRLLKEKIDYIYISPLGRAIDTAKEYLSKSKANYEIFDWLREVPYTVEDHQTHKQRIPWDFKVEYFTSLENIYNNDLYLENPLFKNSNFYEGYKYIVSKFDELLASHGYVRENNYYKVIKENSDTLVFFCHLGLECVLLSRLFNLPFPALAQHFAPVPSSVSIIYSEERKPGIAQFRAQCLGDISHLNEKGITPSFMGRFREKASDKTRAD